MLDWFYNDYNIWIYALLCISLMLSHFDFPIHANASIVHPWRHCNGFAQVIYAINFDKVPFDERTHAWISTNNKNANAQPYLHRKTKQLFC